MKHNLWMIIGCMLPLLLIFISPLLGIRSDVGIFGFIVLMFLCHLFMMRGHNGERTEQGGQQAGDILARPQDILSVVDADTRAKTPGKGIA